VNNVKYCPCGYQQSTGNHQLFSNSWGTGHGLSTYTGEDMNSISAPIFLPFNLLNRQFGFAINFSAPPHFPYAFTSANVSASDTPKNHGFDCQQLTEIRQNIFGLPPTLFTPVFLPNIFSTKHFWPH